MVDLSVFRPYLDAAPGAVLEVPIGVFFVDDSQKPPFPGAEKGVLMPLAIKFTINNQHVYSPRDE